MPLAATPAIVLSALRYSETSKIVRLATRDLGVQSAIAKGALRPKSRFGAALQILSEGQAQLLTKEGRELNVLTAFDLRQLHVGLAADLERYAIACAMAEVMLRFAPPDPHPESFEVLQDALTQLESVPPASVPVITVPIPRRTNTRSMARRGLPIFCGGGTFDNVAESEDFRPARLTNDDGSHDDSHNPTAPRLVDPRRPC